MASKVPPANRETILPVDLVFRFLQNRSRVSIWLYENTRMRIEGNLVGFDEYMNLVLDKPVEHYLKSGKRVPIPKRICLKGDNVMLVECINPKPEPTTVA